MTGKKNTWEGVIRLPFLPIDELLRAEQLYCDCATLTENEMERNVHKETLEITYDENEVQTVPSCNPLLGFADITNCCTKVTVNKTSTLEPDSPFTSKLIVGTLDSLPGFPLLSDLQLRDIEKRWTSRGKGGGGKGRGAGGKGRGGGGRKR